MPRYEGTTVSDASCDFVRLFQAAFENFLTRAGYIFWLGQAKGLWLNPNWFHLNGLNHSHCCPAVQLSGGDTPSLGMTGVFTGSHLDLIITYDSSPGNFDRNTFVAYLVPVDSWFHLFFNHWTSGYSGKTQFFFSPGEFCIKISPTLPGCTRKTSCCLGGRTCRRGGPGAFALWFRAKMCDIETVFLETTFFVNLFWFLQCGAPKIAKLVYNSNN